MPYWAVEMASDRGTFWVFVAGSLMVLAGIALWNYQLVVQGSPASGSYTYVAPGVDLVFAGWVLMLLGYSYVRRADDRRAAPSA